MRTTFLAHYRFVITAALAAATIACSSSDSGGSSAGSGASACETLAGKCGGACTAATETVDCPVGTYCGSDGVCIAQCVQGEVSCPAGSSCGTNGRCIGGGSAGTAGTGAMNSGGSAGNSTGAGGTGPTGAGGSAGGGATGPTDGIAPIDPNSACALGAEGAQLKPVNMLIMFDRSGSMNDDDKWPQAAAALTAFFQADASTALRVALRFFPDDLPVAGCQDSDCSAAACSEPLVALGELTADPAPADTQEAALVSAVETSFPDARDTGGTPLYAALEGAEQWAVPVQASHPDENTVVVLVTDGSPNGCNESISDIAQLAADALASNGVLTYAVGIEGSNPQDMDEIAQAGGTGAGIFIGAGNAEAELLAALDSIRGRSLSCDFPMPQATMDRTIDPTLINVNYTPGGSATELIGQTTSDACATGGWYYDDATAPTRIFLCPNTCARVQADRNASLQIVIGCRTVSIF